MSKNKLETIGMIDLVHGISEGQMIIVGKKRYFFKHVAVTRIDAYSIVNYFIVLDEKNRLHVLDANTQCNVI